MPGGKVVARVVDVSEGGFGVLAHSQEVKHLSVGTCQEIALKYGDLQLEERMEVRTVESGPEGFRLGLQLNSPASSSLDVVSKILTYLRLHEEFVRTHAHI
ncbi:multidrug transporter [Novimethylophilus kurashikiensis]|uniref:Multidrug transporter n=2 Tax=Novimethylophilus kurashikiensis TaxID=1825523 RepID=A0A2R5FBE8_9PROT|nr:multidrug transporter [Novimethylophilus kurashikiensis]